MRTIERLVLYVSVCACVFLCLERVQADDDAKALVATKITLQAPDGRTLLVMGQAKDDGGAEIILFNKQVQRVCKIHARPDHDGEVILYDEKGRLRANLGGNDDGGYCNIWNRSGDPAAYIGADGGHERGYMALYGPKRKKALELLSHDRGGQLLTRAFASDEPVTTVGTANESDTGFMTLKRAGSDPGLALFSNDHGGQCIVFDGKGAKTGGLGMDAGGTALLTLGRPSQHAGLALFSSKDGGQCVVFNKQGGKAGFLGVSGDPAGNGLLYVADVGGKRLVEMGRNSLKGGYLSIRNGTGKRVVFMGATSGTAPDDGVVEVSRADGQLGVVLRAYRGGNSARVYDATGKVLRSLK